MLKVFSNSYPGLCSISNKAKINILKKIIASKAPPKNIFLFISKDFMSNKLKMKKNIKNKDSGLIQHRIFEIPNSI